MIVCRSKAELAILERNSQLLVSAIDAVENLFAPGVSTDEIDRAIASRIEAIGGTAAFKGYHGFPSSCCTNINEEVSNTLPSSRTLRKGDLLKLQVGMVRDGYFTKIQHTYAIGSLPEQRRQLFLTTKRALWAGIAAAIPGNRVSDISVAVQQTVESAGFNVVREFVGHGIGTSMHEEPQVPNYGLPGRGPRLTEGMVLLIHPMTTSGKPAVKVKTDGWTAITHDGGDSCSLGHVVVITNGKPEILTFSPRDHMLEEEKREALVIVQIGKTLRVFPLDDLGIHNITDPETRSTIICGSAQLIQRRTSGFFSSQIEAFEMLINKADLRESELQRFFELNPTFLLGTEYKSLRSQIVLPQEFGGDLIPDFFLEPIAGTLWDVVELKLPKSQLAVGRRNREHFAHSVFEACAQLRTYANYFDDPRQRSQIYERYGILAYKPRVCVIIGRQFELSDLVRRQIELDLPWVRVVTYQDLLEKAKRRLLA